MKKRLRKKLAKKRHKSAMVKIANLMIDHEFKVSNYFDKFLTEDKKEAE